MGDSSNQRNKRNNRSRKVIKDIKKRKRKRTTKKILILLRMGFTGIMEQKKFLLQRHICMYL